MLFLRRELLILVNFLNCPNLSHSMKVAVWIKAFRLRTLPLALSSTILGSFLAFAKNRFSWSVFVLATLTTLFLQILSNLANDYGDTLNGADNENRIGPERVTQSGLVSRFQMRSMIIIFVVLSLITGTLLIFKGLHSLGWEKIFIFFILGISAIYAAIKYTVGKNPYGYVGLGDVFVFIYFGIAGVAGTYYLHVNSFDPWILLPASAIGLLSSCVLNLNNMRDIESDSLTGKRTLVVRMGSKQAKVYHILLLALSLVFSLIYSIEHFNSIYQFIFVLTFPFFFLNAKVVLQNTKPVELNAELKNLAITTFVFSLTFGLGVIL
jgi:1,4-dihydroxy-2-naphthoate octaprenyltransferase